MIVLNFGNSPICASSHLSTESFTWIFPEHFNLCNAVFCICRIQQHTRLGHAADSQCHRSLTKWRQQPAPAAQHRAVKQLSLRGQRLHPQVKPLTAPCKHPHG